MDETRTVGDRLRVVRKRRGLTQRQVARLAGVSLSLISKLEQGERQDTRTETLRRLAVALGVPPCDPNGKLYKRRLRDPYWEGPRAGDLTGWPLALARGHRRQAGQLRHFTR
jgi:transcriptional regulator with XRE-family HTH domain